MSAAIKEVVSIIESIAPKEMAYEWDNTGLLIKCADSVDNLLITLDVTSEVIQEAVQNGCDMILSHHPLIFNAISSLCCDEYIDSLVMELIRRGISLYCAHTSFDRAMGGINDTLAQKLGLSDVLTIGGNGEDLMRVGKLNKNCNTKELVDIVKTSLGCKYVKVSDHEKCEIEKVAVVGGSGGDYIAVAKEAGAQALITGEAKHSHYLEARELGVLLVAAGHYETESLFTDVLLSGLQLRIDKVQLHLGLKTSQLNNAPYSIV